MAAVAGAEAADVVEAVVDVAGVVVAVAGLQAVGLTVLQVEEEAGGCGSQVAGVGAGQRGEGEGARPLQGGVGGQRSAQSRQAAQWQRAEGPSQAPRAALPQRPGPCAVTQGRSETLGKSRADQEPGK